MHRKVSDYNGTILNAFQKFSLTFPLKLSLKMYCEAGIFNLRRISLKIIFIPGYEQLCDKLTVVRQKEDCHHPNPSSTLPLHFLINSI